jgi:hypothetical protein
MKKTSDIGDLPDYKQITGGAPTDSVKQKLTRVSRLAGLEQKTVVSMLIVGYFLKMK